MWMYTPPFQKFLALELCVTGKKRGNIDKKFGYLLAP